jgi:CubicO group peptidase (beta-lactamase class C family)
MTLASSTPMTAFEALNPGPLAANGDTPAANPVMHPRVSQAIAFLDVWLEAVRDYDQIPGLVVAVVAGQETVYSRGFGVADRERKIPATPGSIFSICSISKLFTALAVMQLRDRGLLRLDDPVAKHLPWFRLEGADPLDPPVTIESLLTHSAGLPREADFPYWTGPEFSFPQRDQVIAKLPGQAMLHPAARRYQYSNLGSTLLGEVVAAVAGEPYDAYVRRELLAPLGLASTTPDIPLGERGRRLARGYSALRRGGGREPVPFFKTNGIAPAAGFASTADDLAAFAKWQFAALEARAAAPVLSGNTLHEMQRVQYVDYEAEVVRGLGFGIWRDGGRTFVGHGGSCPGHRSQLLLQVDDQVAVVVLANAQGVDTKHLAQVTYEIMAPALRAARNGAAATLPALGAFAGVYDTGFASELAILPWEGDLFAVELPAYEPLRDAIRLRRSGPCTFRRVRRDDTLAEPVEFELNPSGRATGFRWHENRARLVR